MDKGTIFAIAVVVFVPAAILWGIFVSRERRARRPASMLGIPPALRPAPADDKLEGPRLQRIQAWGLVATLVTAVFIPLYWLPEKTRQTAFEERFDEHSIERGALVFAVPPPLEEDIPAADFKALEKELSLGLACANCHGAAQPLHEEPTEATASGGFANPAYRDPVTGRFVNYAAPPLNNVFQRWDEEVIRFTIERGRPGTPMPPWGVEYGGPMTQMMVDDVINWLKTLPGNQEPPPDLSSACDDPTGATQMQCGQEIFEARCAVCHGPEGQGKDDNATLTNIPGLEDEETGEPIQGPTWYQGMALWKGDVRHLNLRDHEFTIRNGRRFAFMPQFAEAPSQGIPPPPYPLTDDQIKAVMAYERTL